MAKKAAKKKRARGKQKMIEGTEPLSIKEIDEAAMAYVYVRDKRVALLEKEIELKEILSAAMKTHELEIYEYDGNVVMWTRKEKEVLKVKRKKSQDEDDE